MTTLAAYNWLRKIPKDFKTLSETPLFGSEVPLDFPIFSKELSDRFGLTNLDVKCTPLDLKEYSEALSGYENSKQYLFQLSPLKENIVLLIPDEAMDQLLSFLTQKTTHQNLVDDELKEGFKHFVFLEVLNALQTASQVKQMTPIYISENKLLEEVPLWTTDISLEWEEGGISARLIFSDELRKEWKVLFQNNTLSPPKKLLSNLYLDVHVEMGKTTLTKSDWKTLNKGDYLVLESCQALPGETKGRAILSVNGLPAFRAKFKNGTLKILETPQFNEIGTSMSTPPENENNVEDEELEDDEEYYDDESEFEDNESDDADNEPLENTDEIDSENISASTIKQKPFNADEIPLDIVIEAGRFQMTVEKLSSLEPGNVIDLNINPDEGVDLVINGIAVAKGELLKVGDTLGVRILDIAK